MCGFGVFFFCTYWNGAGGVSAWGNNFCVGHIFFVILQFDKWLGALKGTKKANILHIIL